jgi:hypothetical protein
MASGEKALCPVFGTQAWLKPKATLCEYKEIPMPSTGYNRHTNCRSRGVIAGKRCCRPRVARRGDELRRLLGQPFRDVVRRRIAAQVGER